MLCDDLDNKIYAEGFRVLEHEFLGRFDALAVDDTILLSSSLDTDAARNSVKIHEYGHLKTCAVNLLRQPKDVRDRFEYRADRAGILEFITLEKLLAAYKKGYRTCGEYCDFLEVTEKYFLQTLTMYARMYGLKKEFEGYVFTFDPLSIKKPRSFDKPLL